MTPMRRVIAVLLLAACGDLRGGGSDGGLPVSDEPVALVADDSTELVGRFNHPGAEAPGLLLLHGLGADRSEWDGVTLPDYATLAMDLRGHGESAGVAPDDDGAILVEDAGIALAWLLGRSGVQADRVAILGSSFGANLALAAAANDARVRAAVLLSPSLDSLMVSTELDLARFEPRPSLMLAAQEDTEASSAVETLGAQGAHVDTSTLSGDAEGAALLIKNAEGSDMVQGWLEEHLASSDPPPADADTPDPE